MVGQPQQSQVSSYGQPNAWNQPPSSSSTMQPSVPPGTLDIFGLANKAVQALAGGGVGGGLPNQGLSAYSQQQQQQPPPGQGYPPSQLGGMQSGVQQPPPLNQGPSGGPYGQQMQQQMPPQQSYPPQNSQAPPSSQYQPPPSLMSSSDPSSSQPPQAQYRFSPGDLSGLSPNVQYAVQVRRQRGRRAPINYRTLERPPHKIPLLCTCRFFAADYLRTSKPLARSTAPWMPA